MHEIGLVSEAVAQLLRDADGRQLEEVHLAVGPGADRATVEHAWAEAVEGTAAEGAAVCWIEAQQEMKCFECGEPYMAPKLDPCPACGGIGLVVGPAPDVAIQDWRPA